MTTYVILGEHNLCMNLVCSVPGSRPCCCWLLGLVSEALAVILQLKENNVTNKKKYEIMLHFCACFRDIKLAFVDFLPRWFLSRSCSEGQKIFTTLDIHW